MAVETDISELEVKSQAFDLLMTMDEYRDSAESALSRAMEYCVREIPA